MFKYREGKINNIEKEDAIRKGLAELRPGKRIMWMLAPGLPKKTGTVKAILYSWKMEGVPELWIFAVMDEDKGHEVRLNGELWGRAIQFAEE